MILIVHSITQEEFKNIYLVTVTVCKLCQYTCTMSYTCTYMYLYLYTYTHNITVMGTEHTGYNIHARYSILFSLCSSQDAADKREALMNRKVMKKLEKLELSSGSVTT